MFYAPTCVIESLRDQEKKTPQFFYRRPIRSFIPLPLPLLCLSHSNNEMNSLLFIFIVCVRALDGHFVILQSLWTKISEM